MSKNTLNILIGGLTLILLGACGSRDQGAVASRSSLGAAPPAEEVLATIDGSPITRRQVEIVAEQAKMPKKPDTPEERKPIVEHLAVQRAVSQEAIAKGLDKTADIADRLELDRQALLAKAYVDDYFRNHPITEADLNALYQKKMKDTTRGTEYKVRHILVETEAEARDIIARLKGNPKAFDALARERSKDASTRDKGGDMGWNWFDTGSSLSDFGAAATKLAKGRFTEAPVKSQFGYHVIMLDGSRPRQPPPMAEVKDYLTREARQEALQKVAEDIKAKIQYAQVPALAAPPNAGRPAEPARQ